LNSSRVIPHRTQTPRVKSKRWPPAVRSKTMPLSFIVCPCGPQPQFRAFPIAPVASPCWPRPSLLIVAEHLCRRTPAEDGPPRFTPSCGIAQVYGGAVLLGPETARRAPLRQNRDLVPVRLEIKVTWARAACRAFFKGPITRSLPGRAINFLGAGERQIARS